ncbi:hypothetical protein EVAR_59596_1 [Eumeta japonica]|uniref:Uncharacterized protein n=1 Tax=Eumeta variegata TaxID=151549 RepID=A0A4C1Z7S3_EUMVA|nr:hypothetical protein EVAR_59596_1 [Eumeta japonica]
MSLATAIIFTQLTVNVHYNARNSDAVKFVTKASQWRKIGKLGRRRKDREARCLSLPLSQKLAASSSSSSSSLNLQPVAMTERDKSRYTKGSVNIGGSVGVTSYYLKRNWRRLRSLHTPTQRLQATSELAGLPRELQENRRDWDSGWRVDVPTLPHSDGKLPVKLKTRIEQKYSSDPRVLSTFDQLVEFIEEEYRLLENVPRHVRIEQECGLSGDTRPKGGRQWSQD